MNFKLHSFGGTSSTIKLCVVLTTDYEKRDAGHERTTTILESGTEPGLQQCKQVVQRRSDNYRHLADSTSCQDSLVKELRVVFFFQWTW